MTNSTIITIGRQFGSGGHEIGNRLSERLDIPLYDNNLISMAARELSISQEAAAKVDETILGKFLSAYVVNMKDYTVFINENSDGVPLSDKVYEAQSAIITKLAARGPCIFVGRCADYILGDYSNCIHTFICAYKEDRIRRIMKIYGLNEKQAWHIQDGSGEVFLPMECFLTQACLELAVLSMQWKPSTENGRAVKNKLERIIETEGHKHPQFYVSEAKFRRKS